MLIWFYSSLTIDSKLNMLLDLKLLPMLAALVEIVESSELKLLFFRKSASLPSHKVNDVLGRKDETSEKLNHV